MKDKKSGSSIDLKFLMRALRSRNFRLYFFGQAVSLTGVWMQQIAMSWLVYRLTNSVFMLGLVGFAGQIPSLFFMPIAGIFADRWNRQRILVVTQIMAMVQAFILVFLLVAGVAVVWHIFVLSIVLGIINAIEAPVRQAFILEVVGKKEDLGNAIALNSMVFHGARLVGPSIAGIVVAAAGEATCFFVNGVTFLAVIFALLAMKFAPRKKIERTTGVVQELKDGFRYTFGSVQIRSILLLVSTVSLMGISYAVLMPVFARDIFKGGPKLLGIMMGASGLGALIGSFFLASRKDMHGLKKNIITSVYILGSALVVLAFSRMLWISFIALIFVGFGMMVQMASSNTFIQMIVEDAKRGRVMSFFTLAFLGVMPFGSLLAGWLSSRMGATVTLFICGVCCILGSLIFSKKILDTGE